MTGVTGSSWQRISAIARKDAAELARNPGAILPAVAMVAGSLIPAFFVVVGAPMIAGRTLEESGEFAEEARAAIGQISELAGLSGNGLIQAFLFHQFILLLLLIPVVGAMALATHSVIGEKQSKALEPLLATPLSTVELLAAKTLTPFVFALALTWVAAGLFIAGVWLVSEPGVWRAMLGVRTFLMLCVLGPLVELAALQLSVIVSSRANDPRSAQQLDVAADPAHHRRLRRPTDGRLHRRPDDLLLGSLGCLILNAILLWVGVQVFQRETILMRWK